MYNDPKHAKLMREYAERLIKDPLEWESWEFRPLSLSSDWRPSPCNLLFDSEFEYRRVSKHPHAELMMEYAKDAMETDTPWERWEETPKGLCPERWMPLSKHPRWSKKRAYRRKSSLSTMA